ncbi:uncharacterized protein SPAPADRAFT_58516 [Spathaspora passalidarum NRRL Y-27907]|uniref:Uncharacterized protein n=1 Tax=Spathaspora passalidarum (strain NRRL Y-27907 / 11-Y1) TaxID=619300 RepID=G3AGF7_SPAPN|nr:uncharacterized protein SPAPADRAFT_58516 [Spathaspora passalidarum NRRL Y-27907]EGW35296.1 hypothetical protein SPAPADRAFT_58516 [Spathaspora passalidarum NRRL Y-27907]
MIWESSTQIGYAYENCTILTSGFNWAWGSCILHVIMTHPVICIPKRLSKVIYYRRVIREFLFVLS